MIWSVITKHILLFILLFEVNHLLSQNLLKDGSFENYRYKSFQIVTNINKFPLKEWYCPTFGTSDYFNRISIKKDVSVPKNLLGYQYPRTGDGYCGISLIKNWYEYLQTDLNSNLIKGQKYVVEFYVSKAENSTWVANGFGVLFTANKLKENNTKLISEIPQIFSFEYISDTSDWIKIRGEFIAFGDEKFITIGCFGKWSDFYKVDYKNYPVSKSAYYYIDDVSITPINVDNTILELNNSSKIESESETLILNTINFATNSALIQDSILPEIDSLAKLTLDKNYYIQVVGYTDNQGNNEWNNELSEKRAQAIAQYLIQKCKLDSEKIEYKGLGSQNPIANNTTDEGKKLNRRVEIVYKIW